MHNARFEVDIGQTVVRFQDFGQLNTGFKFNLSKIAVFSPLAGAVGRIIIVDLRIEGAQTRSQINRIGQRVVITGLNTAAELNPVGIGFDSVVGFDIGLLDTAVQGRETIPVVFIIAIV